MKKLYINLAQNKYLYCVNSAEEVYAIWLVKGGCIMIKAPRGRVVCEAVSRERVLPSGLILPDKAKSEKKDNVGRCISTGRMIHFLWQFADKFTYKDTDMFSIKDEYVIATEDEQGVAAVGSRVIITLEYAEHSGKDKVIITPDGYKALVGEYWGNVVSVGPDYPDRLEKGDKILYYRNDGHTLRGFYDRVDYLSVKERWVGGKICNEEKTL